MYCPAITQVLSFFKKNNYPDIETKNFFNHYQSNGWLTAGITRMSDWQSSAHKWMLNAQKFETVQKKANASLVKDFQNNKDFPEPL
jgi:hypothetical protein